jgi:hypothetical protein
VILALSFLADGVSFLSVDRFFRPSATDGHSEYLPRSLVEETAPPSSKRVEIPRPKEQEGAPEPPQSPSSKWVETPRLQEQEDAPEPPQSGGVAHPITISDGSGDDRLSREVRSVGEEVRTSVVGKRTPWPIGLHSVEERRKKEKEDRRQEPRQPSEELPQLQRGESLEDELEQCRQQELLELQRQQQQQSQQLEDRLEPPPLSPRQPESSPLEGPEVGEEELPVYGPPTPVWLRRGCLLLSRLSQGEQTVWWRLPVPCAPLRTLSQRSRARFMVLRGSLLDFF